METREMRPATRPERAANCEAAQRTVAAIAAELERRALAFEAARDPRCVFALSYARLSRVLEQRLPSAGFDDPDWIAGLAQVFVRYYFRALDEYDAGSLPRGAWAIVFEASRTHRTSVLEELVLGMTAHIVNDLPQALCEVSRSDAQGRSRIADYQRMNDVLGAAIDAIQSELAHRYDRLLGVLDHLAEHYDEILTNYGIRISRAAAWYNADRLNDPTAAPDALSAIARSPEVTIREVLEPPLWSLRLVVRALRVVSHFTRRWPAHERARRTQSAARAWSDA